VNKFTVTFRPYGLSVEVEEGQSLSEAARKADVFITNLCGGEGVCGQCKVQIKSGAFSLSDHARGLLTASEVESGVVLACQTAVHDHMDIFVPPESRLEGEQIMTGGTQEKPSVSEEIPIVRKILLELPPPSQSDNIADVERILRELRRKFGWHSYEIPLACLQKISGTLRENDWRISVTLAKDKQHYRMVDLAPPDSADQNFGLAVDVGTTTVVAQLIDIPARKVIAVEGSHNKQAQFGEDVISRMIYACKEGGLAPVHKAVIENINALIEKMAQENEVSPEQINGVVAAGNTTMSHFLLGLTPCTIRVDPYVPTADIYPQITARDLGINVSPKAILETIPSVASYVGGDIVAGVLACGIPDHPEVKGLIDVGTNGEIAIGNQDWLVCCSASAGPAFEGGGTRCGMRAIRGAIEKVHIVGGRVTYQTIGNGRPRGICGSGLIDCIYELVNAGIIGADGRFHRNRNDPRFDIVDDIPQYCLAFPLETESGEAVVIAESDILNLIKSKAAVFAAIKCLLDYIGMGFDQIHTFYVAGGFGNFLNISKAVGIGLLPDIPRERIQFVGNSSLTGARMCLLSEKALETCFNISRSMTNIELSSFQPFMDEYIAAMFLPHTERRLFPSIQY
jgi:uncharacterized 2Fe-2S/4Fe-4S cluster protein (DUF4445 family)